MTKKDALRQLGNLSVNYEDRNRAEIKKLDTAIDMAIKALKDQRAGKWVHCIVDKDAERLECSECRYLAATRWRFCPNCGAEME